MRTLCNLPLCFVTAIIAVLLSVACIDSVEPAGPAQYVNPEYPSELKGYAVITAQFSGAFELNGRVFVLDRETEIIESFSLSDPCLNLNPSPVDKDSLYLGFTPGAFALDRESSVLYLEDSDGNDIYTIHLPDGIPELLHDSDSFITDLFLTEGKSSLLICFLGPEWLVRKIDVTTGSNLGEYETGWPVTGAALSNDAERVLLSNSGKYFLLELDVATMNLRDTLHIPERPGPFLYNSAGNIVVFNRYTIRPRIYLYHGDTGIKLQDISSINPYQACSLMPGTDVIIAPRKSDSRISIFNSDNMIFAPSLYCLQYAKYAFSTQDGEFIIALSSTSGRVYVFENAQ
ncbi:MAG: hypothetical protein KAH54_10470 [Candidatus Sabulitectum sp.]|nr:hypothetical protein [Candidatus Sabulitectum sp.]